MKGGLASRNVYLMVVAALFALTLMVVITATVPNIVEGSLSDIESPGDSTTPDGSDDSSETVSDGPNGGDTSPGGADGGSDTSDPVSSSGCELSSSGGAVSTGFEDSSYRDQFTYARHTDKQSLVSDSFEGQNALQVHYDEGTHYGTTLGYRFDQESGDEPEELYAQFAMKFGENWRAYRDGKLPGFAGRYDEAGWGGRPVDGTDGWSARGIWKEGNSQQDTRIGYYVYHADMSGEYGDHMAGDKELQNGEWYCVRQHMDLNTPGENDGVLEMWVDGEKVVDRNDIRWRDVSDLKIQEYWMNLYYGGQWTAPQDMNVYFDNFQISREPISDDSGDTGGEFSSSPSNAEYGPQNKDSWNLAFEDSFEGGSLDSSKWGIGFGWGRETDNSPESITEDEVAVQNDKLHLSASPDDGVTAGAVNTKNKFTTGPGSYWEARIKMPKREGFLPAFWSKPNTEEWPPEIDFVELFQDGDGAEDYETAHYNVHYSTSTRPGDEGTHEDVPGHSYRNGDLTQDFHVYGAKWTENSVEFYFDGEKVDEISDETAIEALQNGGPQYMMFTIHVDRVGSTDRSETWDEEMVVDWVRVWERQ